MSPVFPVFCIVESVKLPFNSKSIKTPSLEEILYQINTMLCLIKVNSDTIESCTILVIVSRLTTCYNYAIYKKETHGGSTIRNSLSAEIADNKPLQVTTADVCE